MPDQERRLSRPTQRMTLLQSLRVFYGLRESFQSTERKENGRLNNHKIMNSEKKKSGLGERRVDKLAFRGGFIRTRAGCRPGESQAASGLSGEDTKLRRQQQGKPDKHGDGPGPEQQAVSPQTPSSGEKKRWSDVRPVGRRAERQSAWRQLREEQEIPRQKTRDLGD